MRNGTKEWSSLEWSTLPIVAETLRTIRIELDQNSSQVIGNNELCTENNFKAENGMKCSLKRVEKKNGCWEVECGVTESFRNIVLKRKEIENNGVI